MAPIEAMDTRQTNVLGGLGATCRRRGLDDLARRLGGLVQLVEADLAAFEDRLGAFTAPGGSVGGSARHLVALGGKRLRPILVLLAARAGDGGGERALDLAVAVELVHDATLLHDDVVDLGTVRRGEPTARTIYGNAASIFAGDWLLVEALRRVRASRVGGVLPRLLDTIAEMIDAESVQLDQRGRIAADLATWRRIAGGKTAALFRWGLESGGRSGGLGRAECRALGEYGRHIGLAFQAVDDLLDLVGDAEKTGKALATDLREGKVTYPIAIALEADPSLGRALEALLEAPGEGGVPAEVLRAVERTGAIDATRTFAAGEVDRAVGALAALPPGPAVAALETAAWAAARREA